jgi:precorrin-6B methylase 2
VSFRELASAQLPRLYSIARRLRCTGPAGRVIALDFLPEMLQRTTAAAHQAGLQNVEPVEGEMRRSRCPTTALTWSSPTA